ncbi:T-cell surface glycoprotein CD1b-3 isoform X3 [Anas platyrhynchos]|uniref:T-cell surface glycoprotein CD1b-3 isoform X3 n=1 Tax=Anas platyrhynchos TaxID=8839 RepID=UPI000F7CB5F2|nr:antigen-presenting glycoprotein CD1d isoform X3 [Anas platyrhynchos]|eukprot:XP_027329025.1 antigen-presenting glycoprotein CD1d isoform X3 [Anas platyrhynchos]
MTVVCQDHPKTAVQTPLAADTTSTAGTAQAEQQQKEVCSCGSCSPFRLVLHPLLNAWGFTTGSMQFPCLLLFILPGMWADPEDPFVFQCRMGCELHPNGSSTKFYRLAYNAHSFVSFDVDSSHWKRWQENELAVNVQRELSSFIGFSASLQYLLNFTCIDHMKRFIEYGRAALERREPPVATVFAHMRDPAQLLLVCRVTGFYPRPISVAWLRDGQEVPPGPGLNTSTILPNADLTYQLRSTLIVAPDDGHTYACRVRHCSLGTHSLLIPWGSSKGALGIGVAVVVLLTVAAACIATVWYYRHRC